MSTPDYDELEPEFGEVMALLRVGLPDLPTERPSESVWTAIATELGDELPGSSLGDGRRPDTVLRSALGAGAGQAGSLEDDGTGGAVVRSITSARSWARPMAMVTGAAAALLVAIPLFLATRGDDDKAQRAELAALEGFDGSGQAEVEGRDLNVRFDGSDAPEGAYYELWLLDVENDEVADLRSLGRVEVAADGRFVIPDDVDLTEFDVVDVSVEPDDGNPEHSGASILRGDLVDL